MTRYTSVTRARPCPVCDGDHKCSVGADGSVQCGRVPDLRPGDKHNGHIFLKLSDKDPQFGVFRREGDPVLRDREEERQREYREHRRPHANGTAHHGEETAAGERDMEAVARKYAAGLTPERRTELAQALGLPEAALSRLRLLGYSRTGFHEGYWDQPCWTMPETNPAGKITGIVCRYRDGHKASMMGSGRSLVLLNGWDTGDGPILGLEGHSDSFAGAILNVSIIGRPSNVGGVDHLAELLKDFPPERDIVIVGEWDANEKGQWPGRDGAAKTAERLAGLLGRPVGWAMPPKGSKDIRAWTIAQNLPNDCLDEWQEAGSRLSAYLISNTITAKPEPAAKLVYTPTFIDSATFATKDFRRDWLIKGVLVRDEPAAIGGPKKGLKTLISEDMAISLASATPFLGVFPVPRACRVAFVSGESGGATLRAAALAIAASKGLDLAQLPIYWDFELPQMSDPLQVRALQESLKEIGAEALVLDPLYLALLSGVSAEGLSASNLYQVGPLLRSVAQIVQTIGCTLILLHHFKQGRLNPYAEPQLDDLAFAGIQEFARQWVLVNRRCAFDPDDPDGRSQLWIKAGGSAGHSLLRAVDICEGKLNEDFTGRRWEVTVQTHTEQRQSAEEAMRRAKQEKTREQDAADDAALLMALDKLDKDQQGVTWNQVQGEARLSDARMDRAATRLKAEVIDEVKVVAEIGSKAKRTVRGLRRKAED